MESSPVATSTGKVISVPPPATAFTAPAAAAALSTAATSTGLKGLPLPLGGGASLGGVRLGLLGPGGIQLLALLDVRAFPLLTLGEAPLVGDFAIPLEARL